jgi:two-component system LytT family response regulator
MMSDILRILAVDDEPLALRRVELLLGRIPGVDLVGKASNGPEALLRIEELRPDVLLLDIKMAGVTGFDLVERLPGNHAPRVVFVTAFDEFAIRAFEVGAIDFVLKPVEFDRLAAAIARARSALAAMDAEERLAELRQVVAALREQNRGSQAKRYESEIWAERRSEFVRVRVADLDWVAAERDYVRLNAHGNSYLLRETISNLEARLDPEQFIRVRRSALVRIDRVTGIRKAGYGDFRVTLADGSSIRVGRTYVKQIRSLIAPRLKPDLSDAE